jgi:DNA-binding transcriptional LysR family regulator
MKIDSLRTFVNVMRTGSFAAAAREEGVTPSAVARVISGLEDELGARLFHRNTRHVTPTSAADVYFNRVEPIVMELESASVAVRDTEGSISGRLRVTAPVTWANDALVPFLPEFLGLYPDVSLDLILEEGRGQDLISQGVDVALRLGSLSSSGCVAVRLSTFHHQACASPRYVERHGRPPEPREVQSHQCLSLSRTASYSRWRFRDRTGAVTEVPVRDRCTISNVSALLRCTADGVGIALLPTWVAAPKLREGTLIDLFPEHHASPAEFDMPIWLLYPSRAHLPRSTRVFIEFVKEKLGKPSPRQDAPDVESDLAASA